MSQVGCECSKTGVHRRDCQVQISPEQEASDRTDFEIVRGLAQHFIQLAKSLVEVVIFTQKSGPAGAVTAHSRIVRKDLIDKLNETRVKAKAVDEHLRRTLVREVPFAEIYKRDDYKMHMLVEDLRTSVDVLAALAQPSLPSSIAPWLSQLCDGDQQETGFIATSLDEIIDTCKEIVRHAFGDNMAIHTAAQPSLPRETSVEDILARGNGYVLSPKSPAVLPRSVAMERGSPVTVRPATTGGFAQFADMPAFCQEPRQTIPDLFWYPMAGDSQYANVLAPIQQPRQAAPVHFGSPEPYRQPRNAAQVHSESPEPHRPDVGVNDNEPHSRLPEVQIKQETPVPDVQIEQLEPRQRSIPIWIKQETPDPEVHIANAEALAAQEGIHNYGGSDNEGDNDDDPEHDQGMDVDPADAGVGSVGHFMESIKDDFNYLFDLALHLYQVYGEHSGSPFGEDPFDGELHRVQLQRLSRDPDQWGVAAQYILRMYGSLPEDLCRALCRDFLDMKWICILALTL